MKSINLLALEVTIGIFLFGCYNQSTMETKPNERSSINSILPSGSPSFSPSTSVTSIIGNFIDKNNLQSPTCQSPNFITGNIYVNDKSVNYFDLKDYLNTVKELTPIDSVDVNYNNKSAKSDSKGVFNIPKSDLPEGTQMTFSKKGYIPFTTTFYKDCLFHIGLSPLYKNELSAKEVKFKSTYEIIFQFKQIPDFFILDKQTKLAYLIIDTVEKAQKFNSDQYFGNGADKQKVIENIDYNKEMQILLTNGQIFGIYPETVDTVMESDSSLLLSSHKALYKTLLPIPPQSPSGDSFSIKIQSIIVPKSNKEIILNISEDIKTTLIK